MRRIPVRYTAAAVALTVVAGLVVWTWLPPARHNVLTPHGAPEVVVMDFAEPFPLDPLPAGWRHRTFWTREAASFVFSTKDGVPALRCETRSSASMLFRYVDIDLAAYPILEWRWFVEEPIDSEIDERTREGDDHPARLFITFRGTDGDERSMEVIWSNRLLEPGDYKYIGSFPHYVANGGRKNVGQWHDERVNLLEIYKHLWPGHGRRPRYRSCDLLRLR